MAMTILSNSSQLAVLGGKPVMKQPEPFPWPPVYADTAKAISKLYLSRRWSWNGPHEQKFCTEFAQYCGAKHGIFMANGTVTLQGALAAYNIGKGDEVIVPGLTWMATAMAVNYVGAKVVFVDIEPTTLCLDPKKVEEAITPRTRAIIPVHLYGSMADMEALNRIARKHKLIVIEDCAHAQGGMWAGRGVGSWGHVGSFSFQQSKTMSSGEGGICLTSDDRIAERLYRFKHIGYGPGADQGKASAQPPADLVCHNYRGIEVQSLILQSQLDHLNELMKTYNDNAKLLEEIIADAPGVRVQARGRLATQQSYYSFLTLWDGPEVANVPMNKIHDAIKAEGMSFVGSTYGAVRTHVLFNLKPKTDYRVAPGGNPVSEGIASKRTAMFQHYWLSSSRATVEKLGRIFVKVAKNAQSLV